MIDAAAALTAALPFLRPAPSQSDEERAAEIAERVGYEGAHDLFVAEVCAALAAVRAEATLAEREACAKIVDPAAPGNAASSMMWNERYALMSAILRPCPTPSRPCAKKAPQRQPCT